MRQYPIGSQCHCNREGIKSCLRAAASAARPTPLALARSLAHLLFQRVSVHFEIQLEGLLGEESRGRLRCPRLSLGWSSEESDDRLTVNETNPDHRVGLPPIDR